MKASILTIGDEILLGQILDTNSRFIARHLTQIGAETVQMRSVSDTREGILSGVAELFASSDVVIVTGGLGPTKDDITKKTLADFFETDLVRNEQAYQWLEEIFAAQPGRLANNAYNQSQALLPQGCTPLHNTKGTAAGMWFEKEGKILVSLPGVPFEMEALLTQEVLPRLIKKFSDLQLRYKMVTVYSITEAELAQHLAAYEETLPAGISLAYLPSPGMIRLRVTAKGGAVAELDTYFSRLLQALSSFRYEETIKDDSAELFARKFKMFGKKISCAESCTGGNVAHLITSVAGASAYFVGGVVSYANDVKQHVLGVRKEDLEKYGAVSETVACQMAEGVRKITGADYGVSTTGIAGPDGGNAEKPVGTVWIAVAGPNGVHAKKYLISPTRERNIGRGSLQALQDLAEQIIKDEGSF